MVELRASQSCPKGLSFRPQTTSPLLGNLCWVGHLNVTSMSANTTRELLMGTCLALLPVYRSPCSLDWVEM